VTQATSRWLLYLRDGLGALLLILLAVFAVVDGPAAWLITPGPREIPVRIGLGIVSFIVLWLFVSRTTNKDLRLDNNDPPAVDQLTPTQLESAMRQAPRVVKRRGRVLAEIWLANRGMSAHCHESISQTDSSFVRSLVQDFEIPAHATPKARQLDHVPFPAVTYQKGQLPSNLKVKINQGAKATVLPHAQVLQLLLHGLEHLFSKAFHLQPGAAYPKDLETLLNSAAASISRFGLQPPNQIPVSQEISQFQNNSTSITVDDAARRRLCDFVDHFSDNYPIVLDIPDGEMGSPRLSVWMQHDVSSIRFGTAQGNRLRRFLHKRLLLDPYVFLFPARRLYSSSSYHLVIQASADTYVYDAYPVLVTPGKKGKKAERLTLKQLSALPNSPTSTTPSPTPAVQGVPNVITVPTSTTGSASQASGPQRSALVVPPYFRRVRSAYGESAEFYGRGFESRIDNGVSILVNLYERPNKILLPTLIASLSVTIAIFFLGWITRDDPAGATGRTVINSDIPALLMSVPVILASWLGLSKSTSALRRTSVSTLLGLYSCLVLSVATICYYLIRPTGKLKLGKAPEVTFFNGWNVISTDPVWFGLSFASLTVAGYLCYTFIGRSSRFAKRVVPTKDTWDAI
jgi:hypothetical protein